jgi:hypothetical protein
MIKDMRSSLLDAGKMPNAGNMRKNEQSEQSRSNFI